MAIRKKVKMGEGIISKYAWMREAHTQRMDSLEAEREKHSHAELERRFAAIEKNVLRTITPEKVLEFIPKRREA